MKSSHEKSQGGRRQRSLRNILINPRYQLKYVFWLSATGISLVVIYSSMVYYYVRENYAILVELSPMDEAAKAQLYRELTEIIVRIGGLSLLFLTFVAALGVVFSHRTAGPLFHFRKVFNRIQQGDLKARIHLRPTDDFREVAQAFNEMMDAVVPHGDPKEKRL